MNKRVVIRGGGDIATGVAHRLYKSGFHVYILEIPEPTVIRRKVAFASAIFEKEVQVEGATAKLAATLEEAVRLSENGYIPVLIDPEGRYVKELKPSVLVDCILAKRNLGTVQDMAPVVIGIGPGFEAGKDVHAVVETKRGHDLGKVFYEGSAFPDTGVPGNIGGYTKERLLKAPVDGIVKHIKDIGDMVSQGDVICTVDGQPVTAAIDGVIRGMINNGASVKKGLKMGDVDPRGEKEYCYTISDKARSVAGGVLEAILSLGSLNG